MEANAVKCLADLSGRVFGELDDFVQLEDVGAGEHLLGRAVHVRRLEILALGPPHEVLGRLRVREDHVVLRPAHLMPVNSRRMPRGYGDIGLPGM